jgi:hydrogenase expression/formation protein HypC
MCHALPVKIIALTGPDTAKVSLGGIVKEISVALIEDPQPGEYVVLHVGYALTRIDEAEAERTLALLAAEGGDAQAEFAASSKAIEVPP